MKTPVLISRDRAANNPSKSKPPSPTRQGLQGTLRKVLLASWNVVRTVAGWAPVTLFTVLAVPLLWWVLKTYGRDINLLGWRIEPWGQGRHDQVITALAGCALILIAAMTAVVVLMALWLRLRLRLPREGQELEAGTATRTGFHLGLGHWNPLLKIDLAWEAPEGVNVRLIGGKLDEEVTASKRGQTGGVVRRVTVGDVFGLARISFRLRSPQPLRVLPGCGKTRSISLLQQAVSGDTLAHPEGEPAGDLIEQRRYVPGDPLKLVLWKVFARTGRMLVRQPERAISHSQQTLAYFVAADGDEPSAGIARAVLESGSLGTDFHFGADGEEAMVQTIPEAVEQVLRSVRVRRESGQGLGEFLGRGEQMGLKACILFVPGRKGRWLETVAREVERFSGPFRVLIGIDGIRPHTAGGRLGRWLLHGEPQEQSTAEEVRAIHERFQRAGAAVCILNRATGDTIALKDL
jgi:hypothetical protein